MNSFGNSDQQDFDNIARGIDRIDTDIRQTNSMIQNEMGNQRTILSRIKDGVGTVGNGIANVYRANKDQYGIDTKSTKMNIATMVGGPIGAAINDALSKAQLDIGSLFKKSVSGVMNKFHGHSDDFDKLGNIENYQTKQNAEEIQLLKHQIKEDKNNSNAIVGALRDLEDTSAGVANRKTGQVRGAKSAQHVIIDGDNTAKSTSASNNLNSIEGRVRKGNSSPNDTAALLCELIKSNKEIGALFQDPNASKTGLMHSIWDLTSTMTDIKFWFNGRYSKDIPRSTNPLQTMTDALLKIYEWERIGIDLSRRQLNELIKSTGGQPQKYVGHEGVAKTFLKQKGQQLINNYENSSLRKIPILGGLGSIFVKGGAMFAGFSDEDFNDYSYAKGHTLLNNTLSGRGTAKKINKTFYDPYNAREYLGAIGADTPMSQSDNNLNKAISSITTRSNESYMRFIKDKRLQEAIDEYNTVNQSTASLGKNQRKKILKSANKDLKSRINEIQEEYGLKGTLDQIVDVNLPGYKDVDPNKKFALEDIISNGISNSNADDAAKLAELVFQFQNETDENKKKIIAKKYAVLSGAMNKHHDNTLQNLTDQLGVIGAKVKSARKIKDSSSAQHNIEKEKRATDLYNRYFEQYQQVSDQVDKEHSKTLKIGDSIIPVTIVDPNGAILSRIRSQVKGVPVKSLIHSTVVKDKLTEILATLKHSDGYIGQIVENGVTGVGTTNLAETAEDSSKNTIENSTIEDIVTQLKERDQRETTSYGQLTDDQEDDETREHTDKVVEDIYKLLSNGPIAKYKDGKNGGIFGSIGGLLGGIGGAIGSLTNFITNHPLLTAAAAGYWWLNGRAGERDENGNKTTRGAIAESIIKHPVDTLSAVNKPLRVIVSGYEAVKDFANGDTRNGVKNTYNASTVVSPWLFWSSAIGKISGNAAQTKFDDSQNVKVVDPDTGKVAETTFTTSGEQLGDSVEKTISRTPFTIVGATKGIEAVTLNTQKNALVKTASDLFPVAPKQASNLLDLGKKGYADGLDKIKLGKGTKLIGSAASGIFAYMDAKDAISDFEKGDNLRGALNATSSACNAIAACMILAGVRTTAATITLGATEVIAFLATTGVMIYDHSKAVKQRDRLTNVRAAFFDVDFLDIESNRKFLFDTINNKDLSNDEKMELISNAYKQYNSSIGTIKKHAKKQCYVNKKFKEDRKEEINNIKLIFSKYKFDIKGMEGANILAKLYLNWARKNGTTEVSEQKCEQRAETIVNPMAPYSTVARHNENEGHLFQNLPQTRYVREIKDTLSKDQTTPQEVKNRILSDAIDQYNAEFDEFTKLSESDQNKIRYKQENSGFEGSKGTTLEQFAGVTAEINYDSEVNIQDQEAIKSKYLPFMLDSDAFTNMYFGKNSTLRLDEDYGKWYRNMEKDWISNVIKFNEYKLDKDSKDIITDRKGFFYDVINELLQNEDFCTNNEIAKKNIPVIGKSADCYFILKENFEKFKSEIKPFLLDNKKQIRVKDCKKFYDILLNNQNNIYKQYAYTQYNNANDDTTTIKTNWFIADGYGPNINNLIDKMRETNITLIKEYIKYFPSSQKYFDGSTSVLDRSVSTKYMPSSFQQESKLQHTESKIKFDNWSTIQRTATVYKNSNLMDLLKGVSTTKGDQDKYLKINSLLLGLGLYEDKNFGEMVLEQYSDKIKSDIIPNMDSMTAEEIATAASDLTKNLREKRDNIDVNVLKEFGVELPKGLSENSDAISAQTKATKTQTEALNEAIETIRSVETQLKQLKVDQNPWLKSSGLLPPYAGLYPAQPTTTGFKNGGSVRVSNSPVYGLTSTGSPYVWGEAGAEAEINFPNNSMLGGTTMYMPLNRRKGNVFDQIINSTQSKLGFADGGVIAHNDPNMRDQIDFISTQVAKNISSKNKFADGGFTFGANSKNFFDQATAQNTEETASTLQKTKNYVAKIADNTDKDNSLLQKGLNAVDSLTNKISDLFETSTNASGYKVTDSEGNEFEIKSATQTYQEDMDALNGNLSTEQLEKVKERWNREAQVSYTRDEKGNLVEDKNFKPKLTQEELKTRLDYLNTKKDSKDNSEQKLPNKRYIDTIEEYVDNRQTPTKHLRRGIRNDEGEVNYALDGNDKFTIRPDNPTLIEPDEDRPDIMKNSPSSQKTSSSAELQIGAGYGQAMDQVVVKNEKPLDPLDAAKDVTSTQTTTDVQKDVEEKGTEARVEDLKNVSQEKQNDVQTLQQISTVDSKTKGSSESKVSQNNSKEGKQIQQTVQNQSNTSNKKTVSYHTNNGYISTNITSIKDIVDNDPVIQEYNRYMFEAGQNGITPSQAKKGWEKYIANNKKYESYFSNSSNYDGGTIYLSAGQTSKYNQLKNNLTEEDRSLSLMDTLQKYSNLNLSDDVIQQTNSILTKGAKNISSEQLALDFSLLHQYPTYSDAYTNYNKVYEQGKNKGLSALELAKLSQYMDRSGSKLFTSKRDEYAQSMESNAEYQRYRLQEYDRAKKSGDHNWLFDPKENWKSYLTEQYGTDQSKWDNDPTVRGSLDIQSKAEGIRKQFNFENGGIVKDYGPGNIVPNEKFGIATNLIAGFESFVPYIYDDKDPKHKQLQYSKDLSSNVKGKATIGYGFTQNKYLQMGEMDQNKGTEILLDHVIPIWRKLGQELPDLNDNQKAALCSFIYDVGETNWNKSTLKKKLLAKDYAGAAKEFAKWKFSGGKVMKGLVNRRAKEKSLFLTPSIQNTVAQFANGGFISPLSKQSENIIKEINSKTANNYTLSTLMQLPPSAILQMIGGDDEKYNIMKLQYLIDRSSKHLPSEYKGGIIQLDAMDINAEDKYHSNNDSSLFTSASNFKIIPEVMMSDGSIIPLDGTKLGELLKLKNISSSVSLTSTTGPTGFLKNLGNQLGITNYGDETHTSSTTRLTTNYSTGIDVDAYRQIFDHRSSSYKDMPLSKKADVLDAIISDRQKRINLVEEAKKNGKKASEYSVYNEVVESIDGKNTRSDTKMFANGGLLQKTNTDPIEFISNEVAKQIKFENGGMLPQFTDTSYNMGPRVANLNTKSMSVVNESNIQNSSSEQIEKQLAKSSQQIASSNVNLLKNISYGGSSVGGNTTIINNYDVDQKYLAIESTSYMTK